MKTSYAILFFSVALLFACQPSDDIPNVDYRKLNLSELFPYYLSINDSIEENAVANLLKDSIVFYEKHAHYDDYCRAEYHFKSQFDTVSGNIKYSFRKINLEAFWGCCKIKERNFLHFYIDSHDRVTERDSSIDNPEVLKHLYVEFIQNPRNEFNKSEKRVVEREFFGEIEVSKGYLVIDSKVVGDSTGGTTSLKKIKELTNVILDGNAALRNKLAQAKWNQSFKELELRKRMVVADIFSLFIIFHFDRLPVPPPPPPAPQEVLDIINDDEDLEDEITE